MKYRVNMLADLDVEVEANNPEEARQLARKKYSGEWLDGRTPDTTYIYIYDEIRFVTDENGDECK